MGLGKSYQHEKNDAAFSVLTPESCYWAGFIAADGCVSERTKPWRTTGLVVSLSVKDADHLRRFCKFMRYSGPVLERNCKCGYKIGAKSVSVAIYAAYKIADDLRSRFNITPRKTKTLQPPVLDGDLAISFMAGFIDGDGSICQPKGERRPRMAVAGTKAMMDWVKSVCDQHFPYTYNSMAPAKVNVQCDGFWSYTIGARRTEMLAAKVRSLNLPVLERKWGKISEAA